MDCKVTSGTQSGVCSFTFDWPIGQDGPSVTLIYTPLPGNVACRKDCATVYSAFDSTSSLEYGFGVLPSGGSFLTPVSFWLTQETVTVTRSGIGTGTVTASFAGTGIGKAAATAINCGTVCSGETDYGVPINLIATPDAGASFTQWTGACAGQTAICTLTPTAAISSNAVFGLASQTTTTTTTTITTTTKTATTTTTPATPTSTTTTTTTPVRLGLQAQLTGVKAGKSRLGFRVEEVEIHAGEMFNATLVLTRKGKQLAHASIPGIRPGDRVLSLPINSSVKKGTATLAVTLTDSAGNRRTSTRAVAIPS
jgi:hypothetical protein